MSVIVTTVLLRTPMTRSVGQSLAQTIFKDNNTSLVVSPMFYYLKRVQIINFMHLHCMVPVLLLHIPPHFPSTSCILNHSASSPTLQHAVKKKNINISFQICAAAFLWVFPFHIGRTFSVTQGCQCTSNQRYPQLMANF